MYEVSLADVIAACFRKGGMLESDRRARVSSFDSAPSDSRAFMDAIHARFQSFLEEVEEMGLEHQRAGGTVVITMPSQGRIEEAAGVTLGDLCTIKTNFPGADFWIIRRGSEKKLGMPSKTFSEEAIGIKVGRTDILLPEYLFYIMQHLATSGHWRKYARGTLALKHISVEDVRGLRVG